MSDDEISDHEAEGAMRHRGLVEQRQYQIDNAQRETDDMRAEIKRLRADVERLTRETESAKACCDSYAEENQRLFDRAEAAERQVEKLRADVERLTLERDRWKDVSEKQASWEVLWAEQSDRAEAAERQVEKLREALIVCEKDLNERGIRHDDFRQQRVRAAIAETEKN